MVYRGVAHGRIIELDETLPFDEGQVVNISVEPFITKTVTGSPQAILAAMRALPDINAEDVDCLEAAIAAGRLPMSARSIFDDHRTDRQA
jgi:hypothetical protein